MLRLEPGDSLGDSLEDSLGDSFGDSLGDSIGDSLGDSIGDSLGDSLTPGKFQLWTQNFYNVRNMFFCSGEPKYFTGGFKTVPCVHNASKFNLKGSKM